ncbi:phosphatidylethanolamine-binding protein 4 isoform X1 [Scyliorhinus canicula]|uniref:phosphatidylethanolamine-binding protein 4 isoform X1 n=1 Tax=Scyliorhinus canicula TaxID=7830 RepID=UPI0018F2BD74|nr:phosphatidylethanolamine-binding protein 4 isoform X1 [Scyliorhinus canicula]
MSLFMRRTNMKWPTTLVLLIGLDLIFHQQVYSSMIDEESMCVIEKMSDSSICRGELLVIYPDLGNAACTIIPRCRQFRRLLSKDWGKPRVKFVQAKKDKNYVLIMVDPDAPSKENPKYRFWRHWLVTNILGEDLQAGVIQGTVLSEYRPPTPPSGTGYHRYQFFLYEQPDDTVISLNKQETNSLGSWDLDSFVSRFNLGSPVASAQLMTQNFED